MSSSANSNATNSRAADLSDKPERSRNAKAQARHRAKRKAYIEQLEQTVTKLQAALGYSPEQVSALPPSSITIRELQQENHRLQKENEELRRALTDRHGRSSIAPYEYRDSYKRRKATHTVDSLYMGTNEYHHERPPPLSIPHYGGISSTNGTHNNSGSLLSMHGSTTFHMAQTPSGSSATSSPPFSPTQMHVHPLGQRPPLNNTNTNGNLPSYSNHGSQYGSGVKVEDDYAPSSNNNSNNNTYQYSNQQPDMDWHYSSERQHLHR